MLASTMIKWNRSEEGYCSSKDGRFHIYPEYMGTTRAQGYRLEDDITGIVITSDRQRDLKRDAEKIAAGQITKT